FGRPISFESPRSCNLQRALTTTDGSPLNRWIDPMRKVTKRLFVSLLLGLAVLTGSVFLVHYFQEGRVRAALLYQVRRAEEQKQPDKVVVYLSPYLDFAPDDLEERVPL